jgi:hypothetical protein
MKTALARSNAILSFEAIRVTSPVCARKLTAS